MGSGTVDQRTDFGQIPQHLRPIGSCRAQEDLAWRLAASEAVTAQGPLHPLPSLQPTVVFSGGSHPGPADRTCPLSRGDANRGPTAKALSAHLVMERELGCLPALLRYLACTFVNHRSLCKQTHPQPSASHRPGNSAARPSILFGCAPARSAAPDKTFWLLSLPASHLGTVGLREEGAVGRGPMSPGDAPWHGCAAAPQRAPSHLRLKRNVKASRKSKH